jgi:hypothetical protein
MNQRSIFRLFAMAALAVLVGIPALRADAANITVLPAVIDGSGVPGDILNYSVTVTNAGTSQENLFATVAELTPSGTQAFSDPSLADRSVSLAAWTSVSRAAILLPPGASTATPITVQIDPQAIAGDYHVTITFSPGNTRVEAEQHLADAPQALLDIAVASNLTASLQIDGFSAVKGFYEGFPVAFHYIIENTGNVASTPSGQVALYDRLGHEVGSLDTNPDGVSIAPGAKHAFTVSWGSGGSFGQYRAMLDVSYGSGEKLESTAIVWILPWKKLAVILGGLFLAMIALALLLHRRYEHRRRRRRQTIEHILKKRSTEEPTRSHIIDLRRHHDHE